MLGYGYCNMFLRTRFNIYYVNIVQLLVLKNIQVLVHQPKQDSITKVYSIVCPGTGSGIPGPGRAGTAPPQGRVVCPNFGHPALTSVIYKI